MEKAVQRDSEVAGRARELERFVWQVPDDNLRVVWYEHVLNARRGAGDVAGM